MTREEILINVGLYYWRHQSPLMLLRLFWFGLGNIEDALSGIWGCSGEQASNRLYKLYRAGQRSCYEEGNLPENWENYLQENDQ